MKNKPIKTNRIFLRIIFVCLISLSGNTNAQNKQTNDFLPSISAPSSLLGNHKPVANWIWDSGPENPRNYYLLIRKTFDLDQIPTDAKAFISAFAYADVYINGKLVDRCPMNCDPEFQVYEKFDLTGYFQKGKNTISALGYNFGTGMHHRINGRGGFFFQAELTFGKSNILRINTDDSWRVEKAEAWDNQTETRTATSNLIGFVEKFDARRMPENWKDSSFDDSNWNPARMLGIPPLAPWNNIVEVNRPPLFREQVYPVNHWFVGDKIVYDFGKEIAGTPVLELFSRRDGVKLEMGTGERLLPDSSVLYKKRVNYTDYYISKKGFQSWGPLTWRGFRYLSLSRNDTMIIKGISAINRHYQFTREGSFECSDPLLNRIWEVGNQTLLLCGQDTYMDTPWREQTHYIAGDSRYLQKYAFYPYGMSSELLIRYNILCGAWSQRWKDDGSIRSRYPTDWLLGEGTSAYLADYELEWIIMVGEYYQYFGNADLIRQIYPNLKKLMVLFDQYIGKEHGLLYKVPGWIVLDHPDTYPMDQTDEITGLNCLYYAALKQAAAIAQNLASDPVQASNWSKQAEQVKGNIRKQLWSPNKHLYMDSFGSTKCSQQTQVYALLYGLVDDAEKGHVVDAIAAGNRSSEQSFSYYLVSSIFNDKPQWALDFIRKNWGGQMKAPFFNGAWHEAWDIANWTTDLGTTSHAWCSGPTALLPQKVLGVEPVSSGWKTFSVRPNPCDLKWAKGVVPSPFGDIVVEWKLDDNGVFKLYVLVPENTSAEISVQGTDPRKVKINDLPAGSCPGIKIAGIENGRIVFIAKPGAYQLSASN
ncbi:MAG: family 78 glycoside hydrolase catalytic domain [Bacteroidota bacterium]|nr:family 78 glycoside hydrolase catalytic domain [Bacteroidota bacterium]